MGETGKGIDAIVAEHRELHKMIASLRTFLEAPRPDVGALGSHTWAADLAERLVKLHDKIFRHFRHEEKSGVFEDICREKPQTCAAVQVLTRDHDRMLADLRALLGAAMVYSEAKTPDDPRLRRWALSLLDHLEQHESEETALFQEAFCVDLGLAD